ncbi:MAG: hypothetical protein ACYC56_03620 [Candidatus Aquicultor sp.]
MLVFTQALIHSIAGYASIMTSFNNIPKDTANLLSWAWLSVGIALALFGLLAVYASSALIQGKRWALVLVTSISATTLIILITPIFIGIGYPVLGIAGALLMLTPLFWPRKAQ